MDAWQLIQQLQRRTLHTIDRGSAFTVDVVRPEYLVVIPDGCDPRIIRRRTLERAACIRGATDALIRAQLQEEFPGNQNTSYILAIVEEIN
jgi:hypothetical protein